MKRNEIEKLLSTNKELCPSESLKKKVYDASLQVVPLEKEYSRPKMSFVKKISIAMVPAMALMLCLFVGVGLSNEKYRSIYIDINPSVEIIVNRFDYIVDVNYLNEDANIEYTSLELKGKKLENAMNNILDKLETEGYLENKEMIISVVSKNEADAEKVLEEVKNKTADFIKEKGKDVNIGGKVHSKEEKVAADEHQLSPAKYKLIEYILLADETYTLEELKDMTVEELAELLNSLSGEKIEEVLEKPFAPKDEKPFGDVDFEQIKGNQHVKPEGEQHVCTEECEEDCELAKPEFPAEGEKPEFDKPQHDKEEQHVCTEECEEDCELAKPEFPNEEEQQKRKY